MTLAAVLCYACHGWGSNGIYEGSPMRRKEIVCEICKGRRALKVEVEGLEPLLPFEAPKDEVPS